MFTNYQQLTTLGIYFSNRTLPRPFIAKQGIFLTVFQTLIWWVEQETGFPIFG